MQLTSHADFALRVLIDLAVRGDRPVSVESMARAHGLSTNHLAKVAQRLVRLGWVTSTRGRSGGLRLSATAWDLRLGTMLSELEPRWDLVECFGSDSLCAIRPACRLKSALHEALRAFFAVLDRYTLRDLVADREELVALLSAPGRPAIGRGD